MKRVFIENGNVTVEANGEKKYYETFVAAAEALGFYSSPYEAAEAMVEAIEAKGEYQVA
jgi:hypothetical protein